MSTSHTVGICVSFLVLTIALPLLADIEGKVIYVTDGDTIKVLDSEQIVHKVRLTGIDAPRILNPTAMLLVNT